MHKPQVATSHNDSATKQHQDSFRGITRNLNRFSTVKQLQHWPFTQQLFHMHPLQIMFWTPILLNFLLQQWPKSSCTWCQVWHKSHQVIEHTQSSLQILLVLWQRHIFNSLHLLWIRFTTIYWHIIIKICKLLHMWKLRSYAKWPVYVCLWTM